MRQFRDLKIPKSNKSRNMRPLCTALLYLALRAENSQRTIKDMLKVADLSAKKFNKALRMAQDALQLEAREEDELRGGAEPDYGMVSTARAMLKTYSSGAQNAHVCDFLSYACQ